MVSRTHSQIYRRFFLAAFITALILSLVDAGNAQARVIICRADPVVWLSNRTKVHLIVEVYTDPEKVDSIQWTLHVPQGVTAEKIIYNQSILGRKEMVTVVADGEPDTLRIETVVLGSESPFQFNSLVRAMNLLTDNKILGEVEGESSQTMSLTVPYP